MRVQKTRYEPVRIAFDTLDQPVIRIEQAPFLAGERLGWRKFLSSLDREIFLQEDDFGSRSEHCPARLPTKLFCPKLSAETTGTILPCSLGRIKPGSTAGKTFNIAGARLLSSLT